MDARHIGDALISTFKTKEVKKPRLATCKVCKCKFVPARPMQNICFNNSCAVTKGRLDSEKQARIAAKAERLNDKKRKDALKSRADWIAALQVVFNKYIRTRDANKPCIDCGKPYEPQKIGGSMDAGHYLSRGSASHLRFDERNVHGQRKNCNRPGGTTRAAFRAGVEARIGKEALEALESDQESRDYTIDDLKQMIVLYRAKTKELLKAGE
ncbi:MAG: recombination protein NinG [Burkholderiaceae bacterium]